MTEDRSPKWAVLRTGGKQYRVVIGQVLPVERSSFFRAAAPAGEPNPRFVFDDVLAVHVDGRVVMGTPVVRGASITAELLPEHRLQKILVFKKRQRKNSRRMRGHRQWVQPIRVLSIQPGEAALGDIESDWAAAARPSPPFESRVDLGAAVSEARRGDADAVAMLALRAVATDWSRFADSDKRLVAAALRPHEADDWHSVARHVAAALQTLGKSRGPNVDVPAPGKPALESYQLSLQVRRQSPPAEERIVLLQVLGSILSDGPALRPGSTPVPRIRPDFTVSGPGSLPGPLRIVRRKEKRPGVAADFVLEFQCRDGDEIVVLSVHVGERTMRRFINPRTLYISRAPPLSLLRDQRAGTGQRPGTLSRLIEQEGVAPSSSA
jgi:large subunit ribosomal protein L21